MGTCLRDLNDGSGNGKGGEDRWEHAEGIGQAGYVRVYVEGRLPTVEETRSLPGSRPAARMLTGTHTEKNLIDATAYRNGRRERRKVSQ